MTYPCTPNRIEHYRQRCIHRPVENYQQRTHPREENYRQRCTPVRQIENYSSYNPYTCNNSSQVANVMQLTAKKIIAAALTMTSEMACFAEAESIIQTIALANMEDGIGEIMEEVFDFETVEEICIMIFDLFFSTIGKDSADDLQAALYKELCKLMK